MSALLYRPNRRWQIWAAFAGAVLVHVAAIAIARNQPQPASAEIADPDGGIDIAFAPPDSAPVDPIEMPPAPPRPVAPENDFAELTATPPPIRKINQRQTQPLVRPANSAIARSARVLALNAPRPQYPYEARRQRTTGSGVVLLAIDSATGNVLDVTMAQSTGSPVLDNATTTAFRRWRFRPRTPGKVQMPITYTLTGASY